MTYSTEQLVPGEADEPGDSTPNDAAVDTVDQAETAAVAYKVVGRQRVDEAKRGDTLYLDPDEPRTARLLARGQIVRVDTTQED